MSDTRESSTPDIGLLFLRVTAGAMMIYGHGWGKLINFSDKASKFPDPLGLGSEVSLALATGAEFFGAALVIVGLATRPMALALVVTMAVAAFGVHWEDGFGGMEKALLFGSVFASLLIAGAGRFSLDHIVAKRSD